MIQRSEQTQLELEHYRIEADKWVVSPDWLKNHQQSIFVLIEGETVTELISYRNDYCHYIDI